MRTIEINLSDVNEERFDDLKKRSKSRNDVHLIAKALAVYQFLIEGKSHEHIVLIKTAQGTRPFKIT